MHAHAAGAQNAQRNGATSSKQRRRLQAVQPSWTGGFYVGHGYRVVEICKTYYHLGLNIACTGGY
ncbi:hypothetical protein GCM10025777_44740 [Membranihabitans marinus]|uniref:Uncharacterized protein n=1 Tax=Nesterenkonia rhizosphaerae TaxID=1348272 RepID=A0ABP9FX21_9MICC